MHMFFSSLFISCSEVDSSTVSVGFLQSDVDEHIISRVHIPSAIDGYNEPELILGEGYERNFRALPTQGSLDVEPWSDTYWPENKGGIAHRWRTDESFDYQIYQGRINRRWIEHN